MSTWAGVLAAGEGRRMGCRPKALLRLGRHAFLEVIARTARSVDVDGIAVVLGYHAPHIEPLARSVADLIVMNPNPALGMSSSASVLAQNLPRGAALLLWPVDYPAVRASTLRALMDLSLTAPDRVISPACDTPLRAGHPPLLPPHVVDALRRRDENERLDHFIDSVGGKPLILEVDDPAIHLDVDQPGDLTQLVDAVSED